jgi:hypothetical protein
MVGGGSKSYPSHKTYRKTRAVVAPSEVSKEEKERLLAGAPASLDWSDVNGVNYVNPVYDQGVFLSFFLSFSFSFSFSLSLSVFFFFFFLSFFNLIYF